MRKFKVLYMNIRGLKSKLGSLCEVMKEEQPEILGIVETMLDDKDDIQIDDYDYDYEIDLFGHIILRKYITMKCIIYKI